MLCLNDNSFNTIPLHQHCQRAVDEDTFNRMVEKQLELLRKERMKPEEPPKPSVPNGQAASSDCEGGNEKEAGDNSEESRDSQQLTQAQNTVEPVTQSSDDSQSQQEVSLPSSLILVLIVGLCSSGTHHISIKLMNSLYLKLICASVCTEEIFLSTSSESFLNHF